MTPIRIGGLTSSEAHSLLLAAIRILGEKLRFVSRMLNKEVLREAFEVVNNSDLGTDAREQGAQIHGEFGKAEDWPKIAGSVQAWIDRSYESIARISDVLLRGTQLHDFRPKLLEFIAKDLVAKITLLSEDDDSFIQDSLSERLAFAGVLPMFGFPTRVRNLYVSEPRRFPPRDVVDRPLDIAISQFAPGSETVRDKQVLRSVGLVAYEPNHPRPKSVDGRGWQSRCGVCQHCQALVRNPQNSNCCPVCASTTRYKIVAAWEPHGFTVEPSAPLPDFSGNFEWQPRSSTARMDCQISGKFVRIQGSNLFIGSAEDLSILTVNDNNGRLFRFRPVRGHGAWVVEEHLKHAWKRQLLDEERQAALVARKQTDVLLVRVDVDSFRKVAKTVKPDELRSKIVIVADPNDSQKALIGQLHLQPMQDNDGVLCEIIVALRPQTKADYSSYRWSIPINQWPDAFYAMACIVD